MGQVSTYSFDDCKLTFMHPALGQQVISGQGVGSVQISMQTNKTAHDIAADASVMVSKIPGDNAQIDIAIQQTSEAHKWFTNYYNFILLAPSQLWAQAQITLEDPSGAIITAFDVSPQKKADKPYQEQGQRITWPFMSANCHEIVI